MKSKKYLLMLLGSLVLSGYSGTNLYPAGNSDDEQAAYRKQWLETESVYGNEYESVIKERERKRDIKLYMDMGKEYLEKKDNPAALFCFKKIVELEAGETKKAYSREAQEFIIKIEETMQRDIINEISGLRKEDWNKRRRGVERILQRKPADLDLAARKKENDPDAQRRKELEEELLRKRKALDEEMKLKKLEMQIKQAETDTMLQYAAELIVEANYSNALEVVNKVLKVEPENVRAHELKNKAMYAIEEERAAIDRTKEETRRALEHLKKKEDDAKQKVIEEKKRQEVEAKQKEFSTRFAAGKKFYEGHNYQQAIEEIKASLLVYPDNSEAKMLLSEIKGLVDEAMKTLETAKGDEDARKALETIKKQKDEEAKRVLEALRKQAEEERKKEVANRLLSGKSYFQQQNYLEAVKDFKAVLFLEPDQDEAKRYLAEIKDVLSKASEALSPAPAPEAAKPDEQKQPGAEQKAIAPAAAAQSDVAGVPVPAVPSQASVALPQKEAVSVPVVSKGTAAPAASSGVVSPEQKEKKTDANKSSSPSPSASGVGASSTTAPQAQPNNKGYLVVSPEKTKGTPETVPSVKH